MVLGQGHEALLIIDKNGSTTFASFGPRTLGPSDVLGAAPSVVKTYGSSSGGLPTVQFGADGLPTADSYRALANKLAEIEHVDPSTVRLNYFKTSEADTVRLKSWVFQQKLAAQEGTGPLCWYNVGFNNCADFTVTGLVEGGALSRQQAGSLSWGFRPNSLFDELQPFQYDGFDLMKLQNQQACVSADGPEGPITRCSY